MYYVEIDWSHLIGHSENRSARHPGDIDIPVSWARESAEDGEATLVDPDYNSKTKLSSRLIGYSRSGKLIITVILVRYQGKLYAASAWQANRKDQRLYQGVEQDE